MWSSGYTTKYRVNKVLFWALAKALGHDNAQGCPPEGLPSKLAVRFFSVGAYQDQLGALGILEGTNIRRAGARRG